MIRANIVRILIVGGTVLLFAVAIWQIAIGEYDKINLVSMLCYFLSLGLVAAGFLIYSRRIRQYQKGLSILVKVLVIVFSTMIITGAILSVLLGD